MIRDTKTKNLMVKDLLNDLERAESAKERMREQLKKDIDRPINFASQQPPGGMFIGSMPYDFPTCFASTFAIPTTSSFIPSNTSRAVVVPDYQRPRPAEVSNEDISTLPATLAGMITNWGGGGE